DGERVRVVPIHAHRERLDAAAEGVGRVWIENGAKQFPRFQHRLDHGRRTDQGAGSHVAVAVEVLRRAVHHQIDTERNRLLVHGAGEGVVDDGRHAAGTARRGNRGDVDAAGGRGYRG